MQIVLWSDNLHELLNLFSGWIFKKYFKMPPAYISILNQTFVCTDVDIV